MGRVLSTMDGHSYDAIILLGIEVKLLARLRATGVRVPGPRGGLFPLFFVEGCFAASVVSRYPSGG